MTSISGPSSDTDDDALRHDVWLSLVPGIGPRLRRALLDRFGTAAAVFNAAPSDLREVAGIGTKLCATLVRARDEIDVEAELAACRDHSISIVRDVDNGYPRMLREIHDPPSVLFVRGQLLPEDTLAIGVVGSRHATQYGLRQSERLAGSLARAGLTVVSGLARGIDAAAHRGALGAGGRTVAVLASGLLNIYPPEHANLAAEVAAHGALLSEAPTSAQPLGGMFPQRNRIISGVSLGVMVVEASLRSGALITARHAMEQGREVFAVPGRVDSRASQGCHRLLRDGAKLVESADDVLEELGPLVESVPGPSGETLRHPAELQLNEVEQQVLSAVGDEPTTIDAVVVGSRLATNQVLSTLSVLEMRRLVRRLSGQMVVRA